MTTTTLDKYTPIKTHEVWHPRYYDYTVLIPVHKIAEHNRIRFTKAMSLKGVDYYMAGKSMKKYKKQSNGTVECYVIPINDLSKLLINDQSVCSLW